MYTIHKYTIFLADGIQKIPMPVGARILSCQVQQGQLVVWALVDPNKPKIPFCFEVFGTGHPIGDRLVAGLQSGDVVHVATAQQGTFVWHVFHYRNG